MKLSIDSRCWISNIKLQKLLYFSWLEYYKRTGEPLFDEGFQAWRYGPVLPCVYYEYWCNAANILFSSKRTSEPIDGDTLGFLQEMLKAYDKASVNEMIERSRGSKPWIDNYEVRMKNTIPIADMKAESSRFSVRRRTQSWDCHRFSRSNQSRHKRRDLVVGLDGAVHHALPHLGGTDGAVYTDLQKTDGPHTIDGSLLDRAEVVIVQTDSLLQPLSS